MHFVSDCGLGSKAVPFDSPCVFDVCERINDFLFSKFVYFNEKLRKFFHCEMRKSGTFRIVFR